MPSFFLFATSGGETLTLTVPHPRRQRKPIKLPVEKPSSFSFPFLLPITLVSFLLISTLFDPQPITMSEQEQQGSIPISFPIKDLEYLESRSYFKSFHYPFNKASVPLPSFAINLPSRPRLLVCHDMAGGYQDDKWIQGGDNPDAYAIWHWYLMDVFVYFSHDLVTIPPPCWTNAAHKHGVKVVGTFITEWDAGKAIAGKLLSTIESSRMYAELLTELAVALGFDGWLINMEVKLDKSMIPCMKEFVSHLTLTMHSSLPGSLVIWYDSVTEDGNLNWQDKLNEKNKPFFDLCDGIFLNYTWKESYLKMSAEVAGKRQFDVYAGIDVFGRQTYGGGQWNVNTALDVLKKANISAAIFAPGWVYETNQPPDFQTAQNHWWSLIKKSWGIVQNYPKELPFYSNFDQGHGFHFAVEGLEVANRPWNNISCQTFQPVIPYLTDSSQNPIEVFIDSRGKCYSGGGKISFLGALDNNSIFRTKIFETELQLGILPIHISYSVSSDEKSLIGLCFWLENTDGEKISVLFAADFQTTIPSNTFNEIIVPSGSVAEQPWILHEASVMKNGYTLTGIEAVCYTKGEQSVVRTQPFEASLGHISIRNSEQNTVFPPATSWFTEYQNLVWSSLPNGSKVVSVKLVWKLKEIAVDTCSYQSFNIFVGDDEKFIGVANAEMFYVSELEVPSGATTVKFTIQVCGLDGSCQKLSESPSLELPVVDH